ncbi:MAG: TolC family protein [Bacteroidales bacterium]|jgi:outer membrane protein
MNTRFSILIISCFFSITSAPSLNAQQKVWTVDDCIQYALQKNIQVQQAQVTSNISNENLLLAKASLYPYLSSSARQSYNWNNVVNSTTGSTTFEGTNGVNISASSSMTLYNASRIRNGVKQSEANYNASQYNIEVIKETVSLNVLNAYLQVLYSEEQVKNDTDQIASLAEQLNLASERLKLGAIANSDYLQVKSQLATEKQTLAAAQSQLAINRIALMQIMEFPITSDFQIQHPNLDSLINQKRIPDPVEVYQTALGIKPEVKNAELTKKSSQIGIDLAKANYYPSLSLNAGVSTSYSGYQTSYSTSYRPGTTFGDQLKNNISPAIGLSASIPIYQNRQVKTEVEVAKLNLNNAELNELYTKDVLRKAIEQACQNVVSNQIEYEASAEAYKAVKESYDVASEKYDRGLMSSIDFLIQKTTFIASQSTFLQSKYALIFSYKILDFYAGQPLSFNNKNK